MEEFSNEPMREAGIECSEIDVERLLRLNSRGPVRKLSLRGQIGER